MTPEEHIYSGMKSRYLVGYPIGPLPPVHRLGSTSFNQFSPSAVKWRRASCWTAKVLVQPTPCSVHYSSDRSPNNEDICRRPLQFRQISQQWRYLSTPTTVPTDFPTVKKSVDVHYSSDRSLNNEDICRRPLQFRQISQQWRNLSTSTTVPTDLSTMKISVDVHYSSDWSLNNEDIFRRPLQFRQISQQLQMSVGVHSSCHEQRSQDSVSVYQAQNV